MHSYTRFYFISIYPCKLLTEKKRLVVAGKVVCAGQNIKFVAQLFKEEAAKSVSQNDREEVDKTERHGHQHQGVAEHLRNKA